jgi:hypothetical protein
MTDFELPLKELKSHSGDISHLTGMYTGNAHRKGVVTIGSRSVYSDTYSVKNLGDLGSPLEFCSKHEPGSRRAP